MAYPSSKSSLDAQTKTGLSTQIVIMVNEEPIGAIQSFQTTQQRSNKKIGEVGTDGFIEIVPQSQTNISLSVTRIVYDGLSVTQAFGRGFVHLQSQRIPFDIMVIDKFFGDSEEEKLITVYKNCWFNNIGKTYQSSDYVISETASIDVETVYTTRNGQPVGLTTGNGQRQVGVDIDNAGAEAAADSGDRRGAMDFPGIISATY
jgi:hypothetical protein